MNWGDVLCDALLLDLLPCTALWLVGHCLLQLLAKPKSGALYTPGLHVANSFLSSLPFNFLPLLRLVIGTMAHAFL